MTALILIGLLPFAALGILLGHLLTVDSVGPAMGGVDRAARAPRRHLVPARPDSTLHDIAQFLPSSGSSRRGTSASADTAGAPWAGP